MTFWIHGAAHDHAVPAHRLRLTLAVEPATAARLLGVWRRGRVV
jgi:hypothetical protein